MKVSIKIKEGPAPLFTAKATLKSITPSEVVLETDTDKINYRDFKGATFTIIHQKSREDLLVVNKDEIFIGYTDTDGKRTGYEKFRIDEYYKDEKVKKFIDEMLEKVRDVKGELKYMILDSFQEISYFFATETPLFPKF